MNYHKENRGKGYFDVVRSSGAFDTKTLPFIHVLELREINIRMKCNGRDVPSTYRYEPVHREHQRLQTLRDISLKNENNE